MGNLLWPLKTRVRMAYLSAVVVAIISAFLSFTPAGKQGMILVSHTLAQAAAGTAATATPPSGEPGSSALASTSATATPQPSPTTPPPSPTPTAARPTPTPTGQTIKGQIGSMNQSDDTFTCTPTGGSAILVHVTNGTQYQGAATTWAGLANADGWTAVVSGTYEADGSFLATLVRSDD